MSPIRVIFQSSPPDAADRLGALVQFSANARQEPGCVHMEDFRGTDGTHNLVYQRALASARVAMLESEGLAKPIAATKLFPPAATQMMRVGEDTGTLDDQLESMSNYYEKELQYKLTNLTTLFEPAVIIFVGLLVGFVALALISAMYGIFNQVKFK